jgi:hypothetical protein
LQAAVARRACFDARLFASATNRLLAHADRLLDSMRANPSSADERRRAQQHKGVSRGLHASSIDQQLTSLRDHLTFTMEKHIQRVGCTLS